MMDHEDFEVDQQLTEKELADMFDLPVHVGIKQQLVDITDLGACDKLSLDAIDLHRRTLRCRMIEIFDYEEEVSFTPDEEEEAEGLPVTTDDVTSDEDRVLRLLRDIDCLIRRIELIQLAIKQRKEQEMMLGSVEEEEIIEDPVDVCGDFRVLLSVLAQAKPKEPTPKSSSVEKLPAETPPLVPQRPPPPPLSCQEQLDIRDLQHCHHLLQCQIDELVCRYDVLRCLLRKLRAALCAQAHEMRRLAKLTQEFLEWSQQVSQERHVCLERYHYLLGAKISTVEAQRVTHNHMINAFRRSKKYLQYKHFLYDVNEFHGEIDELMQYAHDLRKEMELRFDRIERQTTRRTTKLDQLQLTGKLAAVNTNIATPVGTEASTPKKLGTPKESGQ